MFIAAAARPSVAPLAGSVDRNVLVLGYPAPGKAVAPLAGSVDRNLEKAKAEIEAQGSLPSRGAWIEIHFTVSSTARKWVAPLAGSVDRNHVEQKGDKHEHQRRSPRGERG